MATLAVRCDWSVGAAGGRVAGGGGLNDPAVTPLCSRAAVDTLTAAVVGRPVEGEGGLGAAREEPWLGGGGGAEDTEPQGTVDARDGGEHRGHHGLWCAALAARDEPPCPASGRGTPEVEDRLLECCCGGGGGGRGVHVALPLPPLFGHRCRRVVVLGGLARGSPPGRMGKGPPVGSRTKSGGGGAP